MFRRKSRVHRSSLRILKFFTQVRLDLPQVRSSPSSGTRGQSTSDVQNQKAKEVLVEMTFTFPYTGQRDKL